MIKRYSILLVVCFLISSVAWAQAEKTYYERAYLQTDKSLYLAGELLWMKFCITDEMGRPVSLSKVGYVELLDSETAQVQVKLELTNGVGEGWMMLPHTLPTGNYRLVAYTRYMRNENQSVFFEKMIPVINTFAVNKTIQTTTDSLPLPAPTASAVNCSLASDYTTYSTRSTGELRLDRLPANIHTLSVSIAGREIVPVVSGMNLKQWKQQLNTLPKSPFTLLVIPEYEGHILTGKVVPLDKEEVVHTEGLVPMLGFTGEDLRLFGGQVDAEANVTFFTKRVSGTHEIVTTVLSTDNRQYRVDIQSAFVATANKGIPEIRLNPLFSDYLLERSVGLQVLYSYMADSMSNTVNTNPLFQWKPNSSYLLDEYTRFTTMEEVVIEFIPSLRFRRINDKRLLTVLTDDQLSFTIGNSLALLDGIPVLDHENIFKYNPLLVKSIDVYRGKYNFGGQVFNGIAMFKTYENNYPSLTVDTTTQFFDYEGTQATRLFYAPKYGTEMKQKTRLPDYRHTLLWQPDLRTNGATSISVPFTTSDLTGDFVITVEGLTTDGTVISASSLIRVE